jgi:DNA repair exonuclease SbcCD ATPase subunit
MPDISMVRAKYTILEKTQLDYDTKLKAIEKDINLINKSKQFLIDFSEFSRDSIKSKIEGLANTALKAIFTDRKLVFRIIGDKQKRGLYYNLYVETDGTLTPLEDASGGGVYDIVSLSLRVSFLKFFEGSLRQTMLLDEPFKNLDQERVVLAVEWLKMISKQMGMQFIIVTHISALIERADSGYSFKIVDGVTEVAKTR